jgi:hypothetical protein
MRFKSKICILFSGNMSVVAERLATLINDMCMTGIPNYIQSINTGWQP